MFNRYKFSPESLPNLLKFVDKCKEKGATGSPEYRQVWEKLLPKNQDLLKQLQKHSESVVISSSSESINVLEEIQKDERITSPDIEIISLNDEESVDEKKRTEDIATVVIQKLKIDGCIADEILSLRPTQVEELFCRLASDGMDNETICLLGRCLISNRKLKSDAILKYFCRYLLIAELKKDEEESMREIFISILNFCPAILCTELAKCCVDIGKEEYPALFENLRYLQAEHKEQFLREFILNCSKVEPGHFPILESLVENQVDFGILKKMMDMFSASSNEYGKDKLFGKLLFHIMQKVGSQIYRFEPVMQNIISNHKTAWRIKMMKLFETAALNNTHSMSQII